MVAVRAGKPGNPSLDSDCSVYNLTILLHLALISISPTCRNLAPINYQVSDKSPKPSTGDSIRSLTLNVTCSEVQGGNCSQLVQ